MKISKHPDLGVFIGLTTFPVKENLLSFYDNEINPIFRSYKSNLKSYLQYKDNKIIDKDLEHYYNPQAYYIFGKFDLAIISLIDDFEFCGRTFRPFSERNARLDNKTNSSFDYKIIAGVHKEGVPHSKYSKKFPLISITTLKINNLLLLREGYSVINDQFYSYINDILEKKFSSHKIDVEIVESLGASEYVILTFSNSYEHITDFLLNIRELLYGELFCHTKLNEEPVFEGSNSTYGFDFELFRKNIDKDYDNFYIPKEYFQLIEKEKISLNTRWFLRPGYLSNFKKEFDEISHSIINSVTLKETSKVIKTNNKSRFRVTAGLGDIIPHTRDYLKIGIALNLLMFEYRAISNNQLNNEFIIESRSFPILNIEKYERENIEEKKISSLNKKIIDKNRDNWIITDKEIKKVIEKLQNLGVAKIIRNKIAKSISNYNSIIIDPVLFLYFLDLTNFIKYSFPTSLENNYSKYRLPIHKINSIIRDQFMHFENAYHNRFFQSAVTREVTDFNTEYFGAIHQTISGYDFAYKSFNKLFEGTKSSNFVIVGSSPKIVSSKFFIKLNYFHVFQPEIFAAICCHESCNFFFDKISKKHLQLVGGNHISELLSDVGFSYEPNNTSDDETDFEQSKLEKIILKNLRRKSDFWEYEELINEYFNPRKKFLKSLIKDIITLKVGYCDDQKLFELWHWNYFSQMSMNYDEENSINEKKFCLLFLRMSFVLSSFNESLSKTDKYLTSNEFDRQLNPPNRVLSHYWLKYSGFINWVTEGVFEIEEFRKLKNGIESFAKRIVSFQNLGDNECEIYEEKLNNLTLESKKEKLRIELESKYESLFEDLKKSNHKHIITLLKNRELYSDDKKSEIIQVSSLLYSLLKYFEEVWLKEVESKNGEKIKTENFLIRRGGAVLVEDRFNYSDILTDQQGGLFCYDKDIRIELFSIRNTFAKSLWNLSLTNKKKFIES